MLSILKGPYLQWPTQNTITIMWETSELSSSSEIHQGFSHEHPVRLYW